MNKLNATKKAFLTPEKISRAGLDKLKVSKQFKGVIRNCKRIFPEVDAGELERVYGNTMGYYYGCQFIGHPQFGTTGPFDGAHTSLVIKETYNPEDDTWTVETLNSIYIKDER